MFFYGWVDPQSPTCESFILKCSSNYTIQCRAKGYFQKLLASGDDAVTMEASIGPLDPLRVN